jgi:glycolate oxidase iron-sulfur subunit
MPPDASPTGSPTVPLGARPAPRSLLVSRDSPDYLNTLACIRCGLCLAVCPTYAVEKTEVQSPRGRVALIRAASEGRLDAASPTLRDHVYNCLDCRACETICPSGVRVGHLVLAARAEAELAHRPSFLEWLVRLVVLRLVLVSGARLALFTRPARLYQLLGLQSLVRSSGLLRRMPRKLAWLADAEGLLPVIPARPLHEELPEVLPARGERRYRVGFFLGCVMSALLAETSRKTVDVLRRNGLEVVTPPGQLCCGAPHAEEGDFESQRRFARHNVDLFSRYELNYVVTDCAACGAETKGYGALLGDEPAHSARAAAFSAKVRDITELLSEVGFERPKGRLDVRATYHEPCHLCHAQGIRTPPRNVLQSIPGLELIELPESDWCCGSAGVYNVTHAERASKLLSRKVANLAATDAQVVVTGNPGCLLQLRAGVRSAGLRRRVAHPVELLAEAYSEGTAQLEGSDPEGVGLGGGQVE